MPLDVLDVIDDDERAAERYDVDDQQQHDIQQLECELDVELAAEPVPDLDLLDLDLDLDLNFNLEDNFNLQLDLHLDDVDARRAAPLTAR